MQILNNKRILVAAAHGDDELLGCAGTLLKHFYVGDQISICIFSDGESSRVGCNGDTNAIIKRKKESEAIAKKLGVKNFFFLDFPDNKMDTLSRLEIAQTLESVIDQVRPTVIYTHHFGDLNIDHQRVHEAVMIANRPMKDSPVEQILCFETVSSTEWQTPNSANVFIPNWYVDISNYLPEKIELLDVYKDEMREWPHPRSNKAVRNLAQWRGSSVGCDAAEAFSLARYIDKESES